MLNFAPLNEIMSRYTHINNRQSYEEELSTKLGVEGIALISHNLEISRHNRRNAITFYDYVCRNGTNELFSYASYGMSTTLVPEVLSSIRGAKLVLDVGCFDGIQTIVYALNMPDSYFIGMDVSKESIKVAKRNKNKYGAENISFVTADAIDSPFVKQFDAIVTTNALHEHYEVWFSGSGSYNTNMLLREKFSRLGSAAKPRSKVVVSFSPSDMDNFETYLIGCMENANFIDIETKRLDYPFLDSTKRLLFATAVTP